MYGRDIMEENTHKGILITSSGECKIICVDRINSITILPYVSGYYEIADIPYFECDDYCMLVTCDDTYMDMDYNHIANILYGFVDCIDMDCIEGDVVLFRKINNIDGKAYKSKIVGLSDFDIELLINTINSIIQ